MENLKPTLRVTFETRGLRWHDSVNLASFSKIKNPRTMEGKITRSRRLLLYWWKFKGRQKISGLENIISYKNPAQWRSSGSSERIPVYNPAKGKSVSLKLSNIRFRIRFKGNLFSRKALKLSKLVEEFPVQKELISRKFEFKCRQKISGWKWRFRFKIRFKRKMFPQSFEALNIRFKIPVQEEFISCKKLKVAEEDLLPWCAVQTWVSCLISLSYY